MPIKQKTLKRPAGLSGIALHTGVRARITINPAPENTGYLFRRTDLPGNPTVKALASNVSATNRGTTIASGDAAVATVEHVLAALAALEVTNALIDMDGPEPPICDGSALPYVELAKEAGFQEQDEPAPVWIPDGRFEMVSGRSVVVAEPADELHISCLLEHDRGSIGTQSYECAVTPESFERDLAPARTFCEFRDLEQLIAMGLVKGGSLDNAIIAHDGALICKEGLRFPDEPVRHKLLDTVGDLALTGALVRAKITMTRPGHSTNIEFAGKILAELLKRKQES
jgi:UDP-3-O-acyl N-acetylglucosamine deacetylase